VAQLSGLAVNPQQMLTNTCYSFVNDKLVVHVASVHRYESDKKRLHSGGRFGRCFTWAQRTGGRIRLELGTKYLVRYPDVRPLQQD